MECSEQGHVGSKTSHQQNPPFLNWRCWLLQVDLYNGRKTVVVVECRLVSKCFSLADYKRKFIVKSAYNSTDQRFTRIKIPCEIHICVDCLMIVSAILMQYASSTDGCTEMRHC